MASIQTNMAEGQEKDISETTTTMQADLIDQESVKSGSTYKKSSNRIEELEKKLAQEMGINQGLKNEKNAQAAKIKELTERLNVYESCFIVPNEVPISKSNETENEVEFEQQFEHLRTRENLSNFMDNYFEMVKQVASLKAKCEKLETDLSALQQKFRNLAQLNINLCTRIENLKQVLERFKGRENDTEDSGNAIQREPHELDGFVNPCNCPVSCGFVTGLFILHKMGYQACNRRLIIEIGGTDCRSSLFYFHKVGLIDEKEEFSAKITDACTVNHALKDAVEKIKNQTRPAFLLIQYEEYGHCVALMPYGECIDVFERQYWKAEEGKRISQISVVNVKEDALKDWEEKYGQQKCEDEAFVCHFGESSNDGFT